MKNKNIIKIFSVLLVCILLSPSLLSAKIKVFTNSTLSPIEIIDSLSILVDEHIEKKQYDISLSYLQQALDLSLDTPQKYHYSEILIDFGHIHFRINNYSLSQQYLFKFIEENDLNSDQKLRSDVLGLISTNYNSLGDINSAHKYRLKSIEIDEKLGDFESLASNYYNLGSLFFYQDVYEKALEYYRKANKIGHQVESSKIVYNSIAAMGSVYGELGEIDLALELNYKSLEIADSLDYMTGKAYSLGNIGSNYLELGEYEKAKMYVERSLKLMISNQRKKIFSQL